MKFFVMLSKAFLVWAGNISLALKWQLLKKRFLVDHFLVVFV